MRYLPAVLVFASAGAGYLYTQDDVAKTLSPSSWISDEGDEKVPTAGEDRNIHQLASASKESIIAVPGPEVSNFAEIFRFDLSPKAVTKRWHRVSTGLSDPRYQGYRVPLVTGTAESDLAGSLTYYFDNRPQVRRITFLGTTGDAGRLIDFLARQYGFRRVSGGNPRITTFRTHYRFSGILQITPAEVLDRDQAMTNYRVELNIER